MDLVYLQPGADFRGYTKVIVDPTEVSFRKNWQKDYNRGSRDLGGKVSDRDVQDAIAKGVVAASDIFTEAWRRGRLRDREPARARCIAGENRGGEHLCQCSRRAEQRAFLQL